MTKLDNPNRDKPFDREQGDYGYRTVDGLEEIVHLPTNKSNMNYWKPETVLNPEGCSHEFVITNMGHREAECKHCGYGLTFHVGISLLERNSSAFILIQKKEYPVSL